MAEAHPTPVVTTGIQFDHGSIPNLWRGDIDALKQEVNDLRTTVGSLLKEIEELKKVKVEAVKSEPLEVALGIDSEESLAPAEPEDVLDHEQMEVTSQDSGDADEQVANVLPRRQTTEEPTWITPPWGEVLFRVNPEYAQRIARANEIVAMPIRAPTPQPQPHEETPPPPPRPPPPAPVVRPTKAIGIIPASQTKRKHNFELIIETPAKRLKVSNYPTLSSSSTGSVASSSRATLDAPPAAVVAPAPVKSQRLPRDPAFRKFRGTPFVINLAPKIRDVAVTRDFMRSCFGAHQTFTFSEPAEDKFDKHGYDHFVFINRDVNPQAPSAPGEPGLITLFDERPWPKYENYRIFGRLNVLPPKWQYMGLYKVTKLPAWTPQEVKRQMARVKAHWALTVKISRWARPMLARIILRKGFGREPTRKEVKALREKLDSKSVTLPSLDTIIAAFENGEEKVYPWKLQCQGYEENLQWEIAITFPGHEKGTKKSDTPANTRERVF